MKRSEVLEAIKLELEDIRIENYFDEKGSEWCANLVLMRIEELGMFPSIRKEDVNYIVEIPEHVDEMLYEWDLTCTWEPENEG